MKPRFRITPNRLLRKGRTMSKHTLRQTACALALLLSCLAFGSGSAFGQSTTQGAIGGVLKDPQGAIVQNANVSIKNEETNKEMTGTTESQGRFRVPPLDVNLSVGGATETVQVTSEAPVINTQQQDFSTNLNQTSINELPTNGQRWRNNAVLRPRPAR